MKYIVLCCLLGINSIQSHKLLQNIKNDDSEIFDGSDVQIQFKFRPNPKLQPWAAKPKPPSTDPLADPYTNFDDGSVYYQKKVPNHFAHAGDDLLMRSLIKNYAVEGKVKGKPNGQFYLTKNAVSDAAYEIVNTHLGYKGRKLDKYVQSRLPKLWKHFDILNKKYLLVEEAPQFFRQLIGDVEINNALQVQIENQDVQEPEFFDGSDVQIQYMFRPNPKLQPWAAKPKPESTDPLANPYTNYDDGSVYYKKKIPEHFSKDSDDLLVRSLITKYAVEGRVNGKPNGQFYLQKKAVSDASYEIVNNLLGYKGAQLDSFVQEKLPKLWKHFDILNKNFLLVEEAPQFFRQLVGEVEVNNKLQMQLDSDLSADFENRPDPVLSPWAAKPVIQVPPYPYDSVKNGFQPGDIGFKDYERKVPERFSDSKDDLLMRSLIRTYAIEGRSKDGKPTGKFFLDFNGVKGVSKEVVQTHLKMLPFEADAYLDEKLQGLWDHWDVNKQGYIEVERIPTLLRSLVGDVEASFGLQMQLHSKKH